MKTADGLSCLECVLSSPCVSRGKAFRKVAPPSMWKQGTQSSGFKARGPMIPMQTYMWCCCCLWGWVCINLDQILKQKQYFLKSRIATQKLSFLLWFAIYYASDWLYAKPGLGGNGKLNKPTIFSISKHLRRYKLECFCITLIQHYVPHCGGFMDFWS